METLLDRLDFNDDAAVVLDQALGPLLSTLSSGSDKVWIMMAARSQYQCCRTEPWLLTQTRRSAVAFHVWYLLSGPALTRGKPAGPGTEAVNRLFTVVVYCLQDQVAAASLLGVVLSKRPSIADFLVGEGALKAAVQLLIKGEVSHQRRKTSIIYHGAVQLLIQGGFCSRGGSPDISLVKAASAEGGHFSWSCCHTLLHTFGWSFALTRLLHGCMFTSGDLQTDNAQTWPVCASRRQADGGHCGVSGVGPGEGQPEAAAARGGRPRHQGHLPGGPASRHRPAWQGMF